jgi:cyclopropane-fatty-acyl-phospholipid synthase
MFAKQILRQLFSYAGDFPFNVTYWDGTSDRFGIGPARFTLTVHDQNILSGLYDDYEIALADAYVNGQWDVDGDLGEIVSLASATLTRLQSLPIDNIVGLFRRLNGESKHRTLGHQKNDVQRHYDIGNDFYKLWLDDSLTYSCAYFQKPTDTLEQAQVQKIDHALKKLRLKPDETLIDIGSGWGALTRRAASKYGVRAVGITLSKEQYSFSCDTLHAQDLEEKCDVQLIDYQSLARKGVQFDKIASVGMIEHVGKPHLEEFSKSTAKLLKPGGLALLHFITSPKEGPLCTWMDKYIFPGAYLPTISEMISHLSAQNFRILDVENLRTHYQMTLDHWSERFEQKVPEITNMFDEHFVRMWRLYLRGCSVSFREGFVEIHQVLVSNGNTNQIPITRDDIYAG